MEATSSVVKKTGRHLVLFGLFFVAILVLTFFAVMLMDQRPTGDMMFSGKWWLFGTFWRFVLYALLIYIGFTVIRTRHTNEAVFELGQVEREIATLNKSKHTMSEEAYLERWNDLLFDLESCKDRLSRVEHAKGLLLKQPLKVFTPVLFLEALFQLAYILFLR